MQNRYEIVNSSAFGSEVKQEELYVQIAISMWHRKLYFLNYSMVGIYGICRYIYVRAMAKAKVRQAQTDRRVLYSFISDPNLSCFIAEQV